MNHHRLLVVFLAILLIALPTRSVGVKAQGNADDFIEFRQWASGAEATSQYSATNYNAEQAIGAPNAKNCGDSGYAWASLNANGKDDLTVTFDVPVIPKQVNIHESYNPGSITSIEFVPAQGSKTIKVPNSADDASGPCPKIFTVTAPDDMAPMKGVIIHLDQSKIGKWDEIDAVELVGLAKVGTTVGLWADSARATSQYGTDTWNANQATGEPNVKTCGDSGNAWASLTATGKDDVTLLFPHAVIPDTVKIYETYNPGAITSVELILADQSGTVKIPESADTTTDCPGVFTVQAPKDTQPVNGVIIHLDQSKSKGWNEIDAVQLVGALSAAGEVARGAEVRQWASWATATSSFGATAGSAGQAIGTPGVETCGDNPNAWASATSTGIDDLTVYFNRPVIPTQVNIHESYNPGSITGIDLVLADGKNVFKVPNSADANTTCPGVFTVTITGDVAPVNGVIIHLDQSKIGNWNEIDAVELVGTQP